MAAFMGFATWYDCYFLSNVSRKINESVMKTKQRENNRVGNFQPILEHMNTALKRSLMN
jgi:hypothetical protein